nr:hypothetical protein [Paracoccus mutanolyticus]
MSFFFLSWESRETADRLLEIGIEGTPQLSSGVVRNHPAIQSGRQPPTGQNGSDRQTGRLDRPVCRRLRDQFVERDVEFRQPHRICKRRASLDQILLQRRCRLRTLSETPAPTLRQEAVGWSVDMLRLF